MTEFRGFLADLIWISIIDPRRAARTILGFQFTREVLWMMVLLVVVLSVILTYVTMIVSGASALFMPGFQIEPMILALIMSANMVFLIFGLFWTGKLLGGQGTINGFIAVVTWLQALLLTAQAAQTVIALVSAQLSSLIGTASLVYGLWILIQFITEAHGFNHWGRGAMVLVLAILGVSAGISLLLGTIGVSTLGLSSYV